MADTPLNQKEAAAELRVNPRWLDDAPIEWMDYRKPGAKKPVKRWSRAAIEEFKRSRTVQPGHASPVE